MIEGFIARLLGIVLDATQRFYNALAFELSAALYVVAAIVITLMIINHVLQIVPLTYGAFMGWALRSIIIVSAASSWTFFEPIYNGMVSLPDSIAGAILGGRNIFAGLDTVLEATWDVAANSFEQGDWRNPGPLFVGVVIWLVGAGLAGVAILIAVMAHVGLALALGLAPVFISALLVNATRDIFMSWTRFTIGFAMILVILAGVVGLSLELFEDVFDGVEAEGDLASWGTFIVACLVIIFLMVSIPSLAGRLAGGVVVAGTGVAAAIGVKESFSHFMRESAMTVSAPFRETSGLRRGSRAIRQSPEQVAAHVRRTNERLRRIRERAGSGRG